MLWCVPSPPTKGVHFPSYLQFGSELSPLWEFPWAGGSHQGCVHFPHRVDPGWKARLPWPGLNISPQGHQLQSSRETGCSHCSSCTVCSQPPWWSCPQAYPNRPRSCKSLSQIPCSGEFDLRQTNIRRKQQINDSRKINIFSYQKLIIRQVSECKLISIFTSMPLIELIILSKVGG